MRSAFDELAKRPVRYVYLLESAQIHMSPVTSHQSPQNWAVWRELCRLAETPKSMSIFFMLNFVCGMFRWIRYRINECVYDFWLKRPKRNNEKRKRNCLFCDWMIYRRLLPVPTTIHMSSLLFHSSTPFFYFALDIKRTDRQLTYYQIISIGRAAFVNLNIWIECCESKNRNDFYCLLFAVGVHTHIL